MMTLSFNSLVIVNSFRCRWDYLLIAILRRIQCGNAFYPLVRTTKLFTFASTTHNHATHAFAKRLYQNTPDRSTQTKQFTIRAAFSQVEQYTQSTASVGRILAHKSCRFSKGVGKYSAPGPHTHTHVPRERTHGANCWKILHSLDLVTSGTHPKTPFTVSHWCVFRPQKIKTCLSIWAYHSKHPYSDDLAF